MAKLEDTSVTGTLTVDSYMFAGVGGGFQNMIIFTSGTTFTFPTAMQVAGTKFRITLVGGGGAGGGSTATAGACGNAGGGGGLVIANLTVVSGLYTITYSVGAAGAAGAAGSAGGAGGNTTALYNSITYTAGGGGAGTNSTSSSNAAGGTATNGTINIVGSRGCAGVPAGFAAATNNTFNEGGHSPRGFGRGGMMPGASSNGLAGTGYGSGGSGARNGATATSRSGGAGRAGLVIIEY